MHKQQGETNSDIVTSISRKWSTTIHNSVQLTDHTHAVFQYASIQNTACCDKNSTRRWNTVVQYLMCIQKLTRSKFDSPKELIETNA